MASSSLVREPCLSPPLWRRLRGFSDRGLAEPRLLLVRLPFIQRRMICRSFTGICSLAV